MRPAEGPDDYEAAAEALALAFVDDPALAHLLPDDATRAERLLGFFSAEIKHLAPEHRQVWLTDDGAAAAIWAHPGRWRVPLAATIGQTRPMARVFGPRLGLALWTQLRLERRHPRNPHHWYLHYIGVEPRHQGRGLGAALMSPVLERCDREGVPAHLEASSERSSHLYARHGFALTETFAMPAGGPPLRAMWREPTAA